MSLYEIYNFCSSAPLPGIQLMAGLLSLGTIISIFKDNKPEFLSDTVFESFSLPKRKIFAILTNLLIIFTTIFGSNYFVYGILDCKDIRGVPVGEYCYYVLATNENDKTYTLPAKIEKIDKENYYVHNVYFKNGGYLYFEDYDEYATYTEGSSFYDQHRNEWNIELTNDKATHPKVKETVPYITTDDCIRAAAVLLHVIIILIHIHLLKEHIHKEDT